MFLLPDKSVWTRKPLIEQPLDELHWTARRRIYWFGMHRISGGFIDGNYRHNPKGVLGISDYNAGITQNAGTDAVIKSGFLRINAAGTTTKFEGGTNNDSLSDPDHLTFVIRIRTRAFQNQGSSLNIFFSYDTSSLNAINFSLVSGNTLQIRSTGTVAYTGVQLDDAEFKTLVYALNASTGQLYVDGLAEDTPKTNTIGTSGTFITAIGGGPASTTRYTDCDIEFAGIFEGEFNASQALSFSKNPYLIYEPEPQWLPAGVTAAPTGAVLGQPLTGPLAKPMGGPF